MAILNFSDGVLRENSDDGHLDILLFKMILVTIADKDETNNGEENEEHVADLAAHLPGRNVTGVSLFSDVINTSVKPVTIAVDMEFFEVTELIERVMFQIVGNDLVLFLRLGLIVETVLGHDTVRLERNVILRVHTGIS